MVKHIVLAGSGVKMKTLTRNFNGAGYGTVLLDGGLGGQASYSSIDNYIETTGRNPKSSGKDFSTDFSGGKGLSDKINDKLKNLNIDNRPKRKNIRLSL